MNASAFSSVVDLLQLKVMQVSEYGFWTQPQGHRRVRIVKYAKRFCMTVAENSMLQSMLIRVEVLENEAKFDNSAKARGIAGQHWHTWKCDTDLKLQNLCIIHCLPIEDVYSR